jgi:hypothetical protein
MFYKNNFGNKYKKILANNLGFGVLIAIFGQNILKNGFFISHVALVDFGIFDWIDYAYTQLFW